MPLQLTVNSRGYIKGANFPLQVNLPDDATLSMLKNGVAHLVPQLTLDRQRITDAEKKPLVGDDKRLTDLNVKSGDALQVKDLGPQISWRTFGPLFIHPVIYLLAPQVWGYFGRPFQMSSLQEITLILVLIHFIKRELETIFVHRFSNATMPLFNIFKNSAHYWLLSGVLLAVGVYSPYHGAKAVRRTYSDDPKFLTFMVALWTLAELGNLHSHLILRWLRPAGTRVRKIPYGGLFGLVSCPNYFFEVLAWAVITVMTTSAAALLFTIVSAAQMTIWAIKKHKAYRREFGNQYPKSRKIMYPFVF
ncbi:hypothetical protein CBS9595_000844 [Malassezia furfur]|nr:hypothetical protein CBS9595_000844 [Malassezia furfur]